MKILVGISGGVDSAFALYKLARHYSVKAVFFRTGFNSKLEEKVGVICNKLAVDWQPVDFEDEFRQIVIEKFVQGYAQGITPNPCIWCNPDFKFKLLLKLAQKWGFDRIATGHYARIVKEDNTYFLTKAIDEKKDQSYFLYRIYPYLNKVVFPLGEERKQKIKEEMSHLFGNDFFVGESQDLCFVHQGDYREFFLSRIKPRSGLIVDIHGQILGYHSGIHNFTVGQRQGLGLSKPGPWYVVKIDPDKALVVVARGQDSNALSCRCQSLVRMFSNDRIEATAKIRYNQPNVGVKVQVFSTGEIEVIFAKPQRGVAKGQHLVLYHDDVVIGGGEISRVFYPWGE